MNTISKGEKPVFAKRISLFLLFLLVLNFSISLVYNFTDVNGKPVLMKQYMEPLFTQNFKIFAPEVPTEKYELFVRYFYDKGVWSSWEKPGEIIRQQYQFNRFSSSGYEYLLYKNAVNELIYAREDAVFYAEKNKIRSDNFGVYVNNSIRQSKHFGFVKYYLRSVWLKKFPNRDFPKRINCVLSIKKITGLSNASINGYGKNTEYWYFPQIDSD